MAQSINSLARLVVTQLPNSAELADTTGRGDSLFSKLGEFLSTDNAGGGGEGT
jgi:hypothetical protein